MPEHWYSNQYLVGSPTAAADGGYGGRGFFDEERLHARRMHKKKYRQMSGENGDSDEANTREEPIEFHFTSGGYQGSIGTPEAGTSGEWYDKR